jgi:competence protein ComEC
MHYWKTKPFLKLLISFGLGIILYDYLDSTFVVTCLLAIMLLLYVAKFTRGYLRFRLPSFQGFLIHLAVLAMGFINMHIHDIRNRPIWFAKKAVSKDLKTVSVIFRICGSVKKKKKSYYAIAEILYLHENDIWKKREGRIALQLPLTVDSPSYQSVYYAMGEIKEIPASANPFFDYRRYMALRNIYHQFSPRHKSLVNINPGFNRADLFSLTNILQKKILVILDLYIRGPAENGLSKALLIGYRDDLDKDIVNAYTNTGVIHVIAISGLHLGLIYALLAWILHFMQKNKKLIIYRAILIVAFLWLFSFLCGASPSVLRSAVMFTCLLAGEALQKENYTGNSLASSAFLLLCIDPMLLWDIGFQLSYSAVASLLIYNRPISGLYVSENAVIHFTWNSVATSIAAQILTTPLVLFHFHQFPLVFILSNLVAVPVSGIILFMLILVCCFSFLPFIAAPLGQLSEWLCQMMNYQVSRLSHISFAVISDIKIDIYGCLLFYALIFSITLWLFTKTFSALLIILAIFLAWGIWVALACG